VFHEVFLGGGNRNLSNAHGVWAEIEHAVLGRLQRAIFILQGVEKLSGA
jgi:hypothetical protein